MKANESRMDENRKALKIALDEAENRCTKLELGRRSLDGDLQRFKLVMNDKETENQVRGGSSFCVRGVSSFYISERWIHIFCEEENPTFCKGWIHLVWRSGSSFCTRYGSIFYMVHGHQISSPCFCRCLIDYLAPKNERLAFCSQTSPPVFCNKLTPKFLSFPCRNPGRSQKGSFYRSPVNNWLHEGGK